MCVGTSFPRPARAKSSRRSTVWKPYYQPTLPWAASLWRDKDNTRLGSANHWNPSAGGVPEPRHPHGDTPSRGACHSHPAVLHCTWTSRRRRNNPPADAAARSVSTPIHPPTTALCPPRDTTDATALQLSSPTTKAVARWRAARRLLTPHPAYTSRVVSQVQYIHNPATPRPIPSAAVVG